MSENQSGELQDPAEPYEVDKVVETHEARPAESDEQQPAVEKTVETHEVERTTEQPSSDE